MGVARLRSGTLKSVVTRHADSGLVLSEFKVHQAPPPQSLRSSDEQGVGSTARLRAGIDPMPPEPTVAQMLGNFAGAMVEWVKRGAPVVPESTYTARLIACRSCPGHHWDESARLGAGKCTHPKCGCTKAKLWLGTSTCPLRHWPS